MSNGKINLEKIILDTYGCATKKEFLLIYDISIQMIKDIMKEACRQTLELAAENAELEFGENEDEIFIDKQSILDTINQIE